MVKRFGWILLAVGLTTFEAWTVFSQLGPLNFESAPILFPLVIIAFTASGLGGWWMLFKIFRCEKHVFPVILVPLLIPNSFLWYYFERITPRRREQPAA
ncbi:MAG: hypothetical protein WBE86_15645 [Candidatus Acidiferrales bacterium]